MLEKLGIVKDLIVFLWKKKKWWLIPIIILLLFLLAIIVIGQVTGLGPLIYPFV